MAQLAQCPVQQSGVLDNAAPPRGRRPYYGDALLRDQSQATVESLYAKGPKQASLAVDPSPPEPCSGPEVPPVQAEA